MLYIFCTLVVVAVVIAISPRRTYSSLFYLVCISFLLVIFSHLFESLANAFTDIEFQTTGILYDPHNELVFAMGNIRFGYTQVYAINSIGNMLFFMTTPMIVRTFIVDNKFRSRWDALKNLMPYTVIPVLNAVFYSPNFSRVLFELYQRSDHYLAATKNLLDVERILNVALVGVVLYSVAHLWMYSRRCRSIWMRSKSRANLISLMALCVSFFYIYYGETQKFYFNSQSVPRTLISNALSAQPIITYDSGPALLVTALVMVVFAVQVRFKFINLPDRLQSYVRPVSGYIFNNRLQIVLHSLKNAVFSQQILIDKILSIENYEERMAALYTLDSVTKKALSEITHYLDVSRNITFQSSAADVEACIRKAWAMRNPPANICLELQKDEDIQSVRFSERDLVEVFTNLMENSFSAISQAGRQQGYIRIALFMEQSQVVIHFRDNGIGMDRQTRRKIFDSYFSTNSTGKNWGLGLTFVKNTVRIQRGEVYVRSKLGEGTMFELVLPMVEDGIYGKY